MTLACVLSLAEQPTTAGKISPRTQLILQMKAIDKISFHDPIVNEQELKDKELLLGNSNA